MTIAESASIVNSSWQYALSDLPNYTEFTNLFDSYRIMAIKIKFIYTSNVTGQGSATGPINPAVVLPICYTVVDHDDSVALTSQTDYEQYESCKVSRLDKPFTRYFKPCTTMMVYKDAVSTGYGISRRSQWMDCSQPGVPYYGFKMGIDPVQYTTGGTILGYLTMITKYYIQCTGTR